MFYSQCLLSRKGPLGAIWVAAYCHKKLKKKQVAETDIISSVDEIVLNEVTVTYRVLGYLLLGVVRIYSKKVEYLFDDCKAVLVKINMYAKDKLHKEAMCAPYNSITLPDTFELDAFDLEIVEDVSRGKSKSHEHLTLEEAWEIARNAYSLDKYRHEEGTAYFASCSDNSPVEDAPPPHIVDVGTGLSPSRSSLQASIEKLQLVQLPQELCPDLEIFSEADEPLTPNKKSNEMNNHEGRTTFMGITLPGIEKLLSVPLPQEKCRDLEMLVETDEPRTPSNQFAETSSHEQQINFLEDNVTGPREPHVLSEEHPVASVIDKTPDKIPNISDQLGDATPEFMVVPTPSRKEQSRRSRKRKVLWDDVLVLSNEVVRRSLHDSSKLVCKRRKAPVTALDTWRAHTIFDLCKDFMKPLILGYTWLEDLFCIKKIKTHKQVEEGKDSINSAVEVLETHCKDSEQQVPLGKSSVDPSTCASIGLVKCTTTAVSDEIGVKIPVGSMGEELPSIDTPDFVFNLMDEDTDLHEKHLNSDELSVRTRAVAKHLSESFQGKKERSEKEILNLESILEGRTRKESARLFYEVLVLKSLNMIDVKQEAPYSDIVLVATTPRLITNL